MSNLYSTAHPNYGYLQPATGSPQIIDVAQQFPWTVQLPGTRPEVPCIELIEYQTNSNQLNTTLKYLQQHVLSVPDVLQIGVLAGTTLAIGGAGVVGSSVASAAGAAVPDPRVKLGAKAVSLVSNITGLAAAAAPAGAALIKANSAFSNLEQDNPFEGLYHAEPTGFRYVLPYFSNQLNKSTSEWSDEKSFTGSLSTVSSTLLAGGFGGNEELGIFKWAQSLIASGRTGRGIARSMYPNFEIEEPKSWVGAQPEIIQFSFDLLNTTSYQEMIRNWQFVNLFAHQNLHQRINVMSRWAPCVYQINIPGIINIPVAAVTQYDISGLGSSRKVNFENRSRLIPEAYRLTFQFKPLLSNNRNFNIANLTGKDFVRVVTPRVTAGQAAGALAGEFISAVDSAGSAAADFLRIPN